MTAKPNEARKTTSKPQTSWNGDVPRALLVLIMYAHRENFYFVCHGLLLSCRSFLIILNRILFEDSTKPFPMDNRLLNVLKQYCNQHRI